jgi:hypothetical protein
MVDFFFALIAIAAAGMGGAPAPEPMGSGATMQGAVATFDPDVVPKGLEAEPQAPTGKFTTAAEVKPILQATKANWIAVREYGGSDLLYFTHLWSWRCGLGALAVSINGGPMTNQPLPPCHTDFASPNAILDTDGVPYATLGQGEVQQVTVQIVYDDLTHDVATFARGDIRIP